MRHLVYSVRYFAVQNISSLLTVTYSYVKPTLLYNNTNYSTLSWRYNRVSLYIIMLL